eukprot:TRINITY_DN14807_c0_g4_i1.p1 TRINITY_DN14807_c0_g4~~TRINITY_DN14807_c0_g4_i1.p1  ORF type:complete len:147 (+),score=35.70 TRINITY_DN14807_c0_g4_i1:57-497(+)
MLGNRKGKLFQFVNHQVRCAIGNNRVLVGQFLAFDRHMNMVLCGTNEYRRSTQKDEEGNECELEQMRPLGLVFVRGEAVHSVIADKPKKKKKKKKKVEVVADPAQQSENPQKQRKRPREEELDEAEIMARRAALELEMRKQRGEVS